METKKIQIFVEKHKDGTYWGTSQNFEGIISSFGDTFEELQDNFKTAFTDHIELAKELEESYANDYEKVTFDYEMDLTAFFELVPELKISSIAKKANINQSLLRQYKTGNKTASTEQLYKIQTAIHNLGKELLSVHF